ncbi:hypothetical protein TNCV_901531 [Trichonephila clavipes]|nr:hypothetical protein TNCV_901531 [Trichonephila clavipes]
MEYIQNKSHGHQEGRKRASTSAQDQYLALSSRRHRWTMTPQLSRDLAAVSVRRAESVRCCRPSKTVHYAWRPVLCVALAATRQEKQDILGTENISRGHHKNGGV